MTHDFAVPAAGRRARPASSWNEQGDVMFEAPARPGTYQYLCQPHQLMMKGTSVTR